MSRRGERAIVIVGGLFLLLLLWLALGPEPAPEAPAPEAQQLQASAIASPAASATPEGSPTRRIIPVSSPYPTAQDPIIALNPPSATTWRGDVVLTLSLQRPIAWLMAEEVITATLTVSNFGTQPVTMTYASVEPLGRPVLPERTWRGPLENREWRQVVSPYESYAMFISVQIPPAPPGAMKAPYDLWGMVDVELPGDEESGSHIETGPIELVSVAIGPRLYSTLEVSDEGWQVRLLGPPQEHPRTSGVLETNFEDGTTSYQWFGGDSTGSWAGRWDGRARPAVARVLLIAPGYASPVVEAALPGVPTPVPQIQHLSFSSREEASAYAGFDLLTVEEIVRQGATIEAVEVISSTAGGPEPINTSVVHTYRTASGSWLQLVEYHYGGSFFFGDEQPIRVGAASGKAGRLLGRWFVQWHIDDYSVVLRAPVKDFSLEQLIDLAESVR